MHPQGFWSGIPTVKSFVLLGYIWERSEINPSDFLSMKRQRHVMVVLSKHWVSS